jgi:hypothetical protein
MHKIIPYFLQCIIITMAKKNIGANQDIGAKKFVQNYFQRHDKSMI